MCRLQIMKTRPWERMSTTGSGDCQGNESVTCPALLSPSIEQNSEKPLITNLRALPELVQFTGMIDVCACNSEQKGWLPSQQGFSPGAHCGFIFPYGSRTRFGKITSLLTLAPGLPSFSSSQQALQNAYVPWKHLQTTHAEERSLCKAKLLGSDSSSKQREDHA